jgi:hypothetical protein
MEREIEFFGSPLVVQQGMAENHRQDHLNNKKIKPKKFLFSPRNFSSRSKNQLT